MTDPGRGGFPPPPGWQPPPPPPRSYLSGPGAPASTLPPQAAPTAPTAWSPARGMLGAAHKPGAMPLRPLTLGDMYDTALRVIRFNPKATVGSAVLVASATMAIPVLVTAILTATVDVTVDDTGNPTDDSWVGYVGSFGSFLAAIVLFLIGSLFVTGMVAHVVAAAAVGKRLSLGEAWAATGGKRLRLVGLALVLWVALAAVTAAFVGAWLLVDATAPSSVSLAFNLVTGALYGCFVIAFWIRVYYLPVPALMLEDVGVLGAIRRAYRLTQHQFWRTLGIGILTVIVVVVASYMLAVPASIIGQVGLMTGGRYALLIYVGSGALAQVVAAAFATPFYSGVTAVQYLDQRMRKEAYDIDLMSEAGLTG